ncbi:hypothetical protein [Gorillibacterium massiliense]|uniref:hypothetical protein n=1 Tax=Gorillibacterium massiliense TaxID=1280390 RepID=UPI001EE2C555|nr:hypothetical protein [Gorillibacterium massiliense]
MGCTVPSKEEKIYQSAIKKIKERQFPQAIRLLSTLGNYKNGASLTAKLRYIMNGDYIAVEGWSAAAVKADGTVWDKGTNADALNSSGWKGVSALSIRAGYLLALKDDGSLVTTCPWTVQELEQSQVTSTNALSSVVRELPNFQFVKEVHADYPSSIIAVLQDGTVKAADPYLAEDSVSALPSWKNIVAVAGIQDTIYGLKAGGTVEATGTNPNVYAVKDWQHIIAIDGNGIIVGLKDDGTVVAAGENRFGEANVSGWTDIIAIAAGETHTVGLKRDGTVVSVGDNSFGQRDVEKWTDIVAIAAGYYNTLGLKKDGTLVIAGDSSASGVPTADVSDASGLLVPFMDVN